MRPTIAGCIGYGDREGRCDNDPDLALNEAGLWCRECELERRRTLTVQMAEIEQSSESGGDS